MTASEIDILLGMGKKISVSMLHKSGTWVEIFSAENNRDNLIEAGEVQHMFETSVSLNRAGAVITTSTMVLRCADFSALRIEIN